MPITSVLRTALIHDRVNINFLKKITVLLDIAMPTIDNFSDSIRLNLITIIISSINEFVKFILFSAYQKKGTVHQIFEKIALEPVYTHER